MKSKAMGAGLKLQDRKGKTMTEEFDKLASKVRILKDNDRTLVVRMEQAKYLWKNNNELLAEAINEFNAYVATIKADAIRIEGE